MSEPQGEPAADVHRLVDIVVEEVSLVDRAANQHQFLIVKRSDMAQSKENEGGNEAAGAGKTAKADAAAMRTAAVSALEALTQAVEQLGEGGDLDSETLTEVAGELRDVMDQLAAAAGVDASKAGGQKPKPGDGKDNADDEEDDEEDADAAAAQRRKSNDLVKSVRDLLGQVKERLATAAATGSPGAGAGQVAEVAGDAVTKALAGIADALKEQGQRLAKLEKKHGLPNSTPTSERPPKETDEDDASWPLDMNHPLDRQSVDKSVSFHDRQGAA